jgi:hypothetical protein
MVDGDEGNWRRCRGRMARVSMVSGLEWIKRRRGKEHALGVGTVVM